MPKFITSLIGGSSKYILGIGGNLIKSISGGIAIRNTGDSADAELTASQVKVSGDSLILNSDATNTGTDRSITLQRPTSGMSASYSLTFPAGLGTVGQSIILSDTGGQLSWGSSGGGSTDVLGTVLTGLTSTSGTIAATDTVLQGFNKTLYGLAAVNTRVDSLTTPNTGFFNGGENATQNRTLGNTTNYNLSLITNNTERLSVAGGGAVNIWSSNRYAVPNGYMPAGSLTIGNLSASYGNGSGWNSNLAQLLLECNSNTEIATHINGIGVFSLLFAEYNATSPNRRLTIGRDMGWGTTEMLRNASTSFLQASTNFSTSSFSGYLTNSTRPNITIGGNSPHLFLISQGAGAGSTTGAIKLGTVGSDGTHRHLNEGQRNDGKYYSIAYYEGTDYNPHNNLSNATGTVQYVMPSYSASNNLSTGIGVGINTDAANILYNLHVRGIDSASGTIGWGLNDGSRTEIKNDANSTDRLGKQSGFFRTTSPTNYFSGASTEATLLIDCRFDNPIYGLQISGNYNNDDLWVRKLQRSWYKILTTLNGWSRSGNDLSTNPTDNKIGSTSTQDVIFIANNAEFFRLVNSSSPKSIQVDGVINLTGATQEIRMGGTKVLGTRGAAISTISNTASGTEIATAVNAIINTMKTHGLIN